MQPLYRLVYLSIPRSGIAEQDILAILKSARAFNSKAHITGFLTFHERCFLQVLEGSREALSETFVRICKDTRHHGVVLMGYDPIDFRSFPAWNMGYLPMANARDERIRRYTAAGPDLKPTDLSVQGAVSLLLEFATEAANKSAPPRSPSNEVTQS